MINTVEAKGELFDYLANYHAQAKKEKKKHQNPQPASTARLLTPTVALLFFKNDTDAPPNINVFATYKKLYPYGTRSLEEIKKAKIQATALRVSRQAECKRRIQIRRET